MLRRSLAFALATTLAACGGSAAGTATPAAPPVTGDTVYPGDGRVDARRLATGTEQVAMTLERAGQPTRRMGSATDWLGTTTLEGRPALVRVNAVTQGTATLVDSTWSDPRTLAPFRHRSQQPGRRLEVDWTGAAVRARVVPASGAAVVKDSAWRVATFDSGNWELLVRALDLAPGVRRVLPVYDTDNLVQWYVATVSDSTVVDGKPAWVVSATLAKAGTATLTIDRATRRLLSTTVPLGQATLRMAPAAP